LDNNKKLISTPPAYEVTWAALIVEHPRTVLQYLIPSRMSPGVVDLLETVQINEERTRCSTGLDYLAESLFPLTPVQQTGQTVIAGTFLSVVESAPEFVQLLLQRQDSAVTFFPGFVTDGT
jgi:hypothetical protein